jgi:threonylcarbamoyladenosine tRNA methylthiotransferase MtaB
LPTFRIITFGCKVNQCDSAGLYHNLTARGWIAAPEGAVPDLILMNTCTVTARADQQARQAVRRLSRDFPAASILVTGCFAQRAPEEVAALPGVRAVLGNAEKSGLADLINSIAPEDIKLSGFALPNAAISIFPSPLRGEGQGGGESNPFFTVTEPGEEFHSWPISAFPGHTRPRLKIQDGCNHGCAYCIVPQVRGTSRSLPRAEVEAALENLAAQDCREVVLTGVDLGQYGRDLDPPTDLAALLRRLRARAWPFRVRLSSLEPHEVTPELLEDCAAWENLCPHFHLPLQSGADAVLRAMGRPYSPEAIRDLVREIHRRFPDAGLGLDVLVGFPGETAADFEATWSMVDSLPVTYLHVFPFSPRPGTPAAELPRLPGREVRRRARIMRDLGRRKKAAFLESQIGKMKEVLVEGEAPEAGWLRGFTDNYLRVNLPGPAEWRNRLLKVRLVKRQGEFVAGEPLQA